MGDRGALDTMSYDAFIFDNDGILATMTPGSVWRTANLIAFQRHGITDPVPDHLEVLDHPTVESLHEVAAEYDFDAASFWQTREAVAIRGQYHEIRSGCKTTFGDAHALRSLDAPIGIVSNNHQQTIDYLVEYHGLGDIVETQYGRDPTLEGLGRVKPDPTNLRRAIDDLDASDPLFVGDSNVDIIAASKLGVDSAFVRRDHRADYDLTHPPTYELDGLYELTDLADGTPQPAKLY